jgi:16S rRNA (uracil1498-N3)-methyltransferase
MTSHRFSFHVPALGAADERVELSGDEHHHLARVLRMAPGAPIALTNGRGLRVSAVVESVAAASSVVRVTGIDEDEPRPARLVLALGVIARPRFEDGLAACVETGITGIVPLVAARCHARAADRLEAARLERVALSAMKQSGRAWLPAVEPPAGIDALIARFGQFGRITLADPDGEPRPATTGGSPDTLAIVGPEAGFTDEEIARMCRAGAQRVSLSDHRLRAETAAIVLTSMLAPRRLAI